MIKFFLFWLFSALLCSHILAQDTVVIALDEIILSDHQIKKFSQAQTVLSVNDSVIERHQGTFTQFLQFQTPFYFKENGAGMVSSVSSRGTTAQQTAVLWNGININSQLNGQTDFNTLNISDYSSMDIRLGGGSVIYGSGAMGGSIHLHQTAIFDQKLSNRIHVGYGSFETLQSLYRFKYGSKRWATQVSLTRNQSDNDYPFLQTSLKNQNGGYYNQSIAASVAFKINEKSLLQYHLQAYDGRRDFSGTLTVQNFNRYFDQNSRQLLEWIYKKNQWTSQLKFAFLTELYQFYENKYAEFYQFGKVKTLIGRYDLSWKPNSKSEFNWLTDFTQNEGNGSSFSSQKRQIFTTNLSWKQAVGERWHYESSMRIEKASVYDSPILFSLGSHYFVTPKTALKAHFSRNYRIPTFNDLYWQGSGNTELNPEYAWQSELGMVWKGAKSELSGQFFYYQIHDLLRWIPNASGLWRPENTAEVHSYGFEILGKKSLKIAHFPLEIQAQYAYTISENQANHNQLIYVPFHVANAQVNYQIKRFLIFSQWRYNGQVFTSSDLAYHLKDYHLMHLGFDYTFGTQKTVRAGFQVQNLWNVNYQNVTARPMPGRNYLCNLTFNF